MTNSERRNEGPLDPSSFEHSSFLRHSSFVIRASSFFPHLSFVAQRFNRIERGGLSRGIKAEENSNRGTAKECEHD